MQKLSKDLSNIPEKEQRLALLVSKIAGGSESALGELYDDTSRLVFSLALRILSDVADAEEVTLDVFMQVWNKASVYDPGLGTATAWLLMITRSRSIDRLRSRQRAEKTEELTDLEVASPGNSPEEISLFVQKRQTIRTALSKIAPQQREVIELAYFSGFTQSEISRRLGQPLGTVKSSIRLGMIKLRELLSSSD